MEIILTNTIVLLEKFLNLMLKLEKNSYSEIKTQSDGFGRAICIYVF